MRKVKSTIAAVGLSAALALGGTVAANAVTVYPAEGGTWNYGLSAGVWAYSDYLVNRCHGTTVINDWGTSRSPNTAAGYWSNAGLNATPWTNNKYYYRVC